MTTLASIRVIDTDTHIVEPPDLWTSRLPAKWGDQRPHVAWDDATEAEIWLIGDRRICAVGASAYAGWNEYTPDHPRRWSDIDAALWDPAQRLERMDEYGIYAQVFYPNVGLISPSMGGDDPLLRVAMVQAYNDYQTDFASVAPDRYLPITCLPFWDLDQSIAELQRCAAKGHKGVSFTQDPAFFGLPMLTDRYWDRLWAAAQEAGLSVNFHIATGDVDSVRGGRHEDNGRHANHASTGVQFFLSNARTISHLICGGICHRFPKLNFVSVESGIGWIPFALDSLDWQWKNCGVAVEHPEYELLPSEYFQRQIYSCFWFEDQALDYVVERIGDNNLMFETDFPHPTSLSPGPCSASPTPQDHIANVFRNSTTETATKVLNGNASRVYGLS